MNLANRLTILRIVLVPFFVMSILYHRLWIALAIFVIASLTDALDGYIARKFDQKTGFGAVIDPLADKLLIMSAYVSLGIVSGLPSHIRMPVYVPLAVISRDVIILMGVGLIFLNNEKIDIKPTIMSKITTFFQMLTIILVLIGFLYSNWVWNITVFFTVLSGLDYIKRGSEQINDRK